MTFLPRLSLSERAWVTGPLRNPLEIFLRFVFHKEDARCRIMGFVISTTFCLEVGGQNLPRSTQVVLLVRYA